MIILTVSTLSDSIRSEITAWTCEDTKLFVAGKPMALTQQVDSTQLNNVFEALANGFELIGPPQKDNYGFYTWWLKKG